MEIIKSKACDFWRNMLDLDPRGTEIISIFSLIAWGLSLIFGNWDSHEAYEYMRTLMTAEGWAVIALMIACAQSIFFLTQDYHMRSFMALVSCLFFSAVAGFTMQEAWYYPSPYIYAVLAVANGWSVAQLSR